MLNSFIIGFLAFYFCFTYYLDSSAKIINNESNETKIDFQSDCEPKSTNYATVTKNKNIILTNQFGKTNFCEENIKDVTNFLKTNKLSVFNDQLYRYLIAYYTLNNDIEKLTSFFISEYQTDFNVNAANYLFKLTENKSNVSSIYKLQDKLIKNKNLYISPLARFFWYYNSIKNKVYKENKEYEIKIPLNYYDYERYFNFHHGRNWMLSFANTKINSRVLYGKISINKKAYSNKRILLIRLSKNDLSEVDNVELLNDIAYNTIYSTQTSVNGDFVLKGLPNTDQEILIEVEKGYKVMPSKNIRDLINSTKEQKVNLGEIQLEK